MVKKDSLIEVGERTALVRRDVIGLIALDFVLRLVWRGVMRVALVIEVRRVHRDDGSAHAPRLGVPPNVVTNRELLTHDSILPTLIAEDKPCEQNTDSSPQLWITRWITCEKAPLGCS